MVAQLRWYSPLTADQPNMTIFICMCSWILTDDGVGPTLKKSLTQRYYFSLFFKKTTHALGIYILFCGDMRWAQRTPRLGTNLCITQSITCVGFEPTRLGAIDISV